MTTPVPCVPESTIEILQLRPRDDARQPVPGKLIGFWRAHADWTRPEAAGGYLYALQSAEEHIADPSSDRRLYFPEDLAPHGGTREGKQRHDYDQAKAKAGAFASLPWPGDHVDPEMPAEERERVAALLDAAPVVASYRGSSNDRLDPEASIANGSCEHALNGWIWPSGLSLYVRKYGLVLPAEMLESISRTS